MTGECSVLAKSIPQVRHASHVVLWFMDLPICAFGEYILYTLRNTKLIHWNGELTALEGFTVSRPRHGQIHHFLTQLECDSCVSINSSTGWFGFPVSLFCPHYVNYFQQRLANVIFQNLIFQQSALKM